MIGAAQTLERAAKRLREEAKHFRSGETSARTVDVKTWMMHKQNDVRHAAETALEELGSQERI